MAKKTNKTDHVLNLISGGGARQDGEGNEEAMKEMQTPPPVDPMAGHTTQGEPVGNGAAQVSIVHTSTKEDHMVANSIKHSLEQELEKAMPEKKAPVKKAFAVKSVVEELKAADVDKSIHDITEEAVKEIKEVQAEETHVFPDEMEDDIIEEDVKEQVKEQVKEDKESRMEEKVVPEVEEDVYEDRFRKDLEERLKEPSPEYTFVNVMEYLVRDKVIMYMEQFGNCTCSRCIEDTAALTLTHLQSKYVVVNKAAIPPLLDYYGHKFAGQITVEITKACIKVNQNPHHNR